MGVTFFLWLHCRNIVALEVLKISVLTCQTKRMWTRGIYLKALQPLSLLLHLENCQLTAAWELKIDSEFRLKS